MRLPRAARPFIEFPRILRDHGFAVATDQSIGFMAAVGLLGPRDLNDIHAAGLAMLAVPPERRGEYDALFRAYFAGQAVTAPAEGDDGDEVQAHEPGGAPQDIEAPEDESPAGAEAAATERLAHRVLAGGDRAALAAFARAAPGRLPRRIAPRRMPSRRGDAIDLRRALRLAMRQDGEVLELPRTRRKTRQRRMILLIDVSGSMRERTEPSLRFAHALVQAADRAEVFTLGTRLTRITPALRLRLADQALARAGGVVADFDGGTRLGEALRAFLSVPRFAGFTRGAAVVVLSDGLERGDPAAMIEAVGRLKRLAWRLDWLSPLAADPGYAPRTEALAAVLPMLDSLAGGGSLDAIAAHVLTLAEAT